MDRWHRQTGAAMEGSHDTSIDPKLKELLREADTSNVNIAAVIQLRPPANASIYPPEQVQETVRKVLSRVAQRVGKKEKTSNVFRFLGSFVVEADAPFLQELLHQPEISTAVANNQSITAISPATSLKNKS
jgi:hypothetical protein